MAMPDPRTVLEQLIRQGNRTVPEWCRHFNDIAKRHRESATLSERQLRRWMAGDVPAAQPASRRIAEKVWHMPFESLIAVPQPMMEGLQPDITESLDQEIAMSTDESAQWIKRSTTGVDPVVLDQLRFEVGQHAVDYLVKPPITLIPELNRTRREVFQLLDAPRQRPRTAATLYLLAGQVCALLAHACADLGRTSAAETHARTAQLAADFAEDQHLRAYVSWIQANVAYWNNDFGQAVYFAENGLAKSSDHSTRLRLASQLARAQAARGNTAAAMAALDLALDLAPNVHPNASEPGVMHFDPAKALYYGSEVHLAIGGRTHNTLALELAENALDLLADSSPAEFRAAAELDAARAHLALGDADAAHYRITRVLDLPVELRTTPIVGRVVSAGTELHALAAQTSTARDMTQQIELFTTYTAERD